MYFSGTLSHTPKILILFTSWILFCLILHLRKVVLISLQHNPWDSQNCEFVIYVFKEEEDAAFVVNNGAVCPVGGKVDYKYESVK